MDLIKQLASTLGMEEQGAQALAGIAMKHITNKADDQTAQEVKAAVPEMDNWGEAASDAVEAPQEEEAGGAGLLGGLMGGGGGGLLGSLAGAVGGEGAQDAAAIIGILGKFGIGPDKAKLAAPVILNFLKDRLSPELLNKVLMAAPFLTMLGGGDNDSAQGDQNEDSSGGVGDLVSGALGGLFGK